MPRYIDADALVENIKRVYCADCNNYNEVRCRACGTDDAITMIDDAPTVEVIVVPCKLGDPIYRVCAPKGIRQRPNVRKLYLTWNNLRKSLEDFGTLVFLTEKEAERVANGKCADS